MRQIYPSEGVEITPGRIVGLSTEAVQEVAVAVEAPAVAQIDTQIIEHAKVVRAKRTVKKKEVPLFWKEKTDGTITELPINLNRKISKDYLNHRTRFLTSPYVNLIPVRYLTSLHEEDLGDYAYRKAVEESVQHGERDFYYGERYRYARSGPNALVRHLIASNRIYALKNCNALKTEASLFLHYNELVTLQTNTRSGHFNDTERLFIKDSGCVYGRTFTAYLGGLSCFFYNSDRPDSEPKAQVMAVVLPENYIYQKQHFLLTGTIDLTKVIILVNKELDSTSFPHKAFRAYYRKHILPIINSLNVDVWKVPQSFITENCSHSGIKLNSVSLIDKTREIASIVDDFCQGYSIESHVFDPYRDIVEELALVEEESFDLDMYDGDDGDGE